MESGEFLRSDKIPNRTEPEMRSSWSLGAPEIPPISFYFCPIFFPKEKNVHRRVCGVSKACWSCLYPYSLWSLYSKCQGLNILYATRSKSVSSWGLCLWERSQSLSPQWPNLLQLGQLYGPHLGPRNPSHPNIMRCAHLWCQNDRSCQIN